jgi:hypothetical protein
MPKNTVTDPITDQEMVFAHLIMSGTMTDRQAAEVAGLNPDTAAYTKAKPRVRDYMIQHRAAVREKLVDQEAEGLRKLNISRDQILDRLWELATLSHEVTRGTIAGQIKALSMIIAIEGMIPSGLNARRLPPSVTQPAPPPINEGEEPGDAVAAAAPPPAAPQPAPARRGVREPELTPNPAPKPATDTSFPNLYRNQPSVANPFIHPEKLTWLPDATGYVFDTVLDRPTSLSLSFPPTKRVSGRPR